MNQAVRFRRIIADENVARKLIPSLLLVYVRCCNSRKFKIVRSGSQRRNCIPGFQTQYSFERAILLSKLRHPVEEIFSFNQLKSFIFFKELVSLVTHIGYSFKAFPGEYLKMQRNG